MDVLEAINTRRSIGRVRSDVPPRDQIEVLLDAAVKAPNHHDNQPWRFFVLTDEARQEFGEALVDALRTRAVAMEPDRLDALCMAERAKPLRAPVLIVVANKHSLDERLMPVEDLEACSAAIENMLLAAHALGLAAQWRTGDGAYDPVVKAHFGLDSKDEIAGVVYIGYPLGDYESNLKPRSRGYAELTEWRGGEKSVKG